MLSYIHAYHAGNHADILKHLTLSLILEHLCKKEKPFCVIDTHAGSGIYSLHDERAQKTGEAESGVRKLFDTDTTDETDKNGFFSNDNPPESVLSVKSVPSASRFFSLVQGYYARGEYPGSPLIESAFLREGDEQILSELHPKAFEELRECFYNRRIECKESGRAFVEPQIHRRDGYELLNALTPPRIRRGLCVIDPSFEDASDFAQCAEVISRVHKKWSSGIIALWYPLIAHRASELEAMKERIAFAVEKNEPGEPKILDTQMEVKRREDMTGLASLYGSGMLIVNFPYRLDEQVREILPALSKTLGQTASAWSVEYGSGSL